MTAQAAMNRSWSYLILEELYRSGVRHVCVAPGSRSTPLTLEADLHPGLELHSHFDERGLGFYALGLAKACQSPVAVVVTSGTAVANLLPAAAEAALTGEPLILLTADRPQTLIDCSANQAIDQSGIFNRHVCWSLDLPSPAESVSPAWLLTSLDQGLERQQREGGAIQINCAFPEPLYGEEALALSHPYYKQLSAWIEGDKPYSRSHRGEVFPARAPAQWWDKKGVIVAGKLPLEETLAAKELAGKLGWPLLCDIQSGVGSRWRNYDLWLQNPALNGFLSQAEVVIQFGARLVSKRYGQWLNAVSAHAEYALVDASDKRLNPDHLPQQRFVASPQAWVKAQLSGLPEEPAGYGWAEPLAEALCQVQRDIAALPGEEAQELNTARELMEWLPDEGELFIGNSLMVRLLDMLASPQERQTYSNRGASGIDGLIATCAGVQSGADKPLLCVIGDTSLLHDLNSLALLRNVTRPVVVLVVNNDGGAIFDLLPVPEQKRTALYQMPHGLGFEHAAALFGLSYLTPQTLEQCRNAVTEHLASGSGTLLVEVVTEPQQASQQLRHLSQAITAHAFDSLA